MLCLANSHPHWLFVMSVFFNELRHVDDFTHHFLRSGGIWQTLWKSDLMPTSFSLCNSRIAFFVFIRFQHCRLRLFLLYMDKVYTTLTSHKYNTVCFNMLVHSTTFTTIVLTKGLPSGNLIKKKSIFFSKGHFYVLFKKPILNLFLFSKILWYFSRRQVNFATYSLNLSINFAIFSHYRLTNFAILLLT